MQRRWALLLLAAAVVAAVAAAFFSQKPGSLPLPEADSPRSALPEAGSRVPPAADSPRVSAPSVQAPADRGRRVVGQVSAVEQPGSPAPAAASPSEPAGSAEPSAEVRRQVDRFKDTSIPVAQRLAEIEALGKKLKSPAKKKSPRALREYILTRLEMVDYRQPLARGWDIGSGPTEAMCKSLTLRLKRPGMKWDADHAAGVMNLLALYESGQAQDYWKHRATHQKAA